MKVFLSIVMSVFGAISFAQEHSVALESPDINLLYRGYPNKIKVAVSNNRGRTIAVSVSNAAIFKGTDDNTFIVKPGKEKLVSLSVLLKDDEGKVEIIKTFKYRVADLPDPELYWSGVKNGNKANIRNTKLFAKYPPEIPLNATFSITKWRLFHKGDTISSNGSNLNLAEDLFKTIKVKTKLVFEVELVGPDGITRVKRGEWIVHPWKDEENDEPQVFKCG